MFVFGMLVGAVAAYCFHDYVARAVAYVKERLTFTE